MNFIIDIGHAYTKIFNKNGPYNSFIEKSSIPVCTYKGELFGTEAYNKKFNSNKVSCFTSLIGLKYTKLLELKKDISTFYNYIYSLNNIVFYNNQIAFEFENNIISLQDLVKKYTNYILDLLPSEANKVYIYVHDIEFYQSLKIKRSFEIIFIENDTYNFINNAFPVILKIQEYLSTQLQLQDILFDKIENILKNEDTTLIIKDTIFKKINRTILFNKLNIKYIRNNTLYNLKLLEDDIISFHNFCTTGSSFGISTLGGVYVPIISKGNSIPIEKSLEFLNSEDDSIIDVEIYTGENRFSKKNTHLDTLHVQLDQPIKRGSELISIKMVINDSFILTTEASSNKFKKISSLNVEKYIKHYTPITIESELKKLEDSQKLNPLLESLELKYLVESYKKMELSDQQIELISCAEYIISNFEIYSSNDLELFAKEFKMRMQS